MAESDHGTKKETKESDKEPVELIPCLFIGSLDAANNHTALHEKGITHVLTLSKEKPEKLSGVQYTDLLVTDSSEKEILENFQKANELIDTVISSGGSILVHCVQGVGRSGSVCIAYIMSKKKQSFATTLRQVKDRRDRIQPQEAFQKALIAFGRSLGVEKESAKVEEDDDESEAPVIQKPKAKRESRLSIMVSAAPTIKKVVRDKTPAFKWNKTKSLWESCEKGGIDEAEEKEDGDGDEEESEIAIEEEQDDKAKAKEKEKTKEKEKKDISKAALRLLEQTTLRVATYNVWYADKHLWPRFRAWSEVLRNTNADIIALQEVRADVLKRLTSSDWVRDHYYVSDCSGFTLGQYGVVILSKLPLERFSWYPLPSSEGRMLLRADFNFNGKTFSLINCHLESGKDVVAVRKEQIAIAQGAGSGSDTSLLVGDFNFHTISDKDEADGVATTLSEHKDVWPLLNKEKKGYTFDGSKNTLLYSKEHHRLDRMYLKSYSGGWTPKSIDLICDQSIPLSTGVEGVSGTDSVIYPSDHFGLIADFVHPEKK